MSHVYSIVPATEAHAQELDGKVRAADAEELAAARGETPGEAMRTGLQVSLEAWAGLADGEVICIFGLAPASFLGGEAVPWLVGSDGVERHALAFLRRCRPVVKGWSERFDLWNYVDARNLRAIAWLRWLGFRIDPAEPYGQARLPFHRFEMRRTHV